MATSNKSTVAGKLRAQVGLELSAEGKWRTKVMWLLPDETPLGPATLDAISALPALPTSTEALNAALLPLLNQQLSFTLALDASAPTAAAPSPSAPPPPAPAAPASTVSAPAPAKAPSAPPKSPSSSTRSSVTPAPAAGKKDEETNLFLDVEAEEGEPPGIHLDEKLMVNKIIAGSAVEGKLELGDVIKSVNKVKVADKEEFWQRWKRALPQVTLEVSRSKSRVEAIKASLLPEEAEKLINRKADCEYLLKNVDCENGSKPLGIQLESLCNRVVVTKVADGSAGSAVFKLWDTISAIDRIRVSDVIVAKHLIKDRAGKFEALIERPQTAAQKAELEKQFKLKQTTYAAKADEDWTKFTGAPDVANIVTAAIPARKAARPAKPILHRSPSQSKLAVSLRPLHVETPIHSDTDPNKVLRKAPKN